MLYVYIPSSPFRSILCNSRQKQSHVCSYMSVCSHTYVSGAKRRPVVTVEQMSVTRHLDVV